MTFRVGQRVVCIKKGKWRCYFGFSDATRFPEYGQIYTVAEIDPDDGGLCLAGMRDVDFWHPSQFRPLISQADDVAMFRKLVETMKPTERLDRLAELLDTTPS
jgi:hypothetical protein